jgi:drug/metabolite transporter (DMT)-like permease
MRLGLALALLSAATFGTSGTFARSLIDAGWSADAAVAARVGIAALILAVPAALALRGRWHVARRSLNSVGLFGLLAVGGAQVGFFNAVRCCWSIRASCSSCSGCGPATAIARAS